MHALPPATAKKQQLADMHTHSCQAMVPSHLTRTHTTRQGRPASGRCTLVVEWGRRSAEKLKVVGSNPTRSIEPEKNTVPGVITMTEDIKNVPQPTRLRSRV